MTTPPEINWNSLINVQDEIHRWASEQFPHRTDHHAIYKLVVEEIPELMMHKKEKGMMGIGLELADCFILLMDLASMWGINLSDAICYKMLINYNRQWNKDENGIMQHAPEQVRVAELATESVPLIQLLASQPAPVIICPLCRSHRHTQALTEQETTEFRNLEKPIYDDARCTSCNITFDSTVPF